jgi:hypothetical protein
VLRTSPPVDSAQAQIEWSESMDELAARRARTGRFAEEPERAEGPERDVLNH